VRVLVISSYPPRHCGIASYASADVARLRGEGHEVVVLSPTDGDGDVKRSFFGGRPFFAAARLAPAFDRVLVHFEPGLYSRRRRLVSKTMAWLGLLWLVLRQPSTDILVHEANRARPAWRPDSVLLRSAFARANLSFHTNAERDGFARAFHLPLRGGVIPHTDGVKACTGISRGDARRRLGLGQDERILLSAGFMHPAKGYDRAVRAFLRAGSPGRLFIVASIRRPTREILAYARDLRSLCETTPGVTLVEEYVSDEDFDAWIAAADVFVLPYRRAWSSGALARARVIGTPAIVSAVGGLAEQAGPHDAVFHTDEQLAELLARPAETSAR
jgi:glycosyltransferase involved in cell wall biosynthesis